MSCPQAAAATRAWADNTCTAALDGDSGVLTQTVTLLAWDDTAQAWADTGKTEAYEYPFTLVAGHAVFSAFPCPY